MENFTDPETFTHMIDRYRQKVLESRDNADRLHDQRKENRPMATKKTTAAEKWAARIASKKAARQAAKKAEKKAKEAEK